MFVVHKITFFFVCKQSIENVIVCFVLFSIYKFLLPTLLLECYTNKQNNIIAASKRTLKKLLNNLCMMCKCGFFLSICFHSSGKVALLYNSKQTIIPD